MEYKQQMPPPAYGTGQPNPGYYAEPGPSGHQLYAPAPMGYPNPNPYGPPQPTTVIVTGHQYPQSYQVHQVHGCHDGTTTVIVQRQGVNHLLHFCISLFFFPWIFVWMILCCTE